VKILNKENKIEYVIGASMLVSKDFIKDIGFMCEDYFLYFEELGRTLRKNVINLDIAGKAGFTIRKVVP